MTKLGSSEPHKILVTLDDLKGKNRMLTVSHKLSQSAMPHTIRNMRGQTVSGLLPAAIGYAIGYMISQAQRYQVASSL